MLVMIPLWFFRGSGPVLHRNPIFLWFFRGGGGWSRPPVRPSGSARGWHDFLACILLVLYINYILGLYLQVTILLSLLYRRNLIQNIKARWYGQGKVKQTDGRGRMISWKPDSRWSACSMAVTKELVKQEWTLGKLGWFWTDHKYCVLTPASAKWTIPPNAPFYEESCIWAFSEYVTIGFWL